MARQHWRDVVSAGSEAYANSRKKEPKPRPDFPIVEIIVRVIIVYVIISMC